MKSWLLLAAVFFSLNLVAHEEPIDEERSREICERALQKTKGEIIVRHDGLSQDYAAAGLKDAIAAREVLNKLGIPTPPHQIIFAPERQLNVLTATGLLPVPHAISGAEIYRAITSGSSLGVLEFAQPGGLPASHSGCATCRSYYSNMTSLRDQRPIYFHVGGHNHVFMKSLLFRKRNVDPIAASELFAQEMEDQYKRHGEEEVSLFYHYLHTANQMQDYIDGTFDAPSELTAKASAPIEKQASTAKSAWSFLSENKTVTVAPWEKTASALQFMVANQPNHVPEYKRSLLEKYEMTVRTYPAVVQQKFVHEGWATFVMMLGQKHSDWTTSRDIFEFARIVSGAAGGPLKVTQPYSFGLWGKYHLYRKFLRRPELKGLSELAKDIVFVEYMDHLFETMTDGDFVNLVVDDEFVAEHNLSLVRQGSDEEMQKIWEKYAKAGVAKEKWPKGIIISKAADRIRRHIGRRVGTKNSPSVRAVNPALVNPFQLNFEQRIVEEMPLEPMSAAQVFFAQTQVNETPVSAVFLLSERWLGSKDKVPRVVPVRMEVRPDGRVRMFQRSEYDTLKKDVQETELPELAAHLQTAVEYYKTDQSFSFSENILEQDAKRWEQMFPKMIDEEIAKHNLKGMQGLADYAPTAARAIIKFSQLIKARFAKQMEAAFQGKLKLKFGPNGVKLPLIPMTPHLQYDQEHVQAHAGLKPPAPMDTIKERLSNLRDIAHDVDDGSMIGPVPGSVGDPVQIPPGGGGQGGPGQEPGDGDDANSITIPANLYRQLLAKHFDIPNPRLTDGETPLMREVRMGFRRDATEDPIWERMTGDALVKGILARRAKGEKAILGHVPMGQIIREGYARLDEEDYIIRSKREIPVPSFDAVVVVNIDLSLSMQGHRLERVRNFVYNIRELFRSVYPEVRFHYVGLDTEAEEYSEEKVWDAFRGGGTAYTPALIKTKEILKKYPRERWNQYVFFAGDSELFDMDEFLKEFREQRKNWQFFGLIVTRDPSDPPGIDSNGLRRAFDASLSEWPWVRHTQINEDSDIFRALGDLFDKKK